METVDETIRRKFESDWLTGSQPEISDYLPSEGSQMYLPTLEELICIDLEFRWSQLSLQAKQDESIAQRPPLLEDYLKRYPELNHQLVLHRLIEQEILARQRSPQPPTFEEYAQRFPNVELSASTFRHQATDQATVVQGATELQNIDQNSFPILFGKYVLVSLLGQGGMGSVYRGYDSLSKRDIAIKVANLHRLPVDHRQEFQQRFESEVKAAARLKHESVVPVFDVGEVDGSLYYTMPILDGDLTELIREQTLSNEHAAKYIAQAARGVEAAHQAGLLHRDIKPHNFMYDREHDRVLVADFGLARIEYGEQQLTQTGELLGTPPYMAPEQIRSSHTIDARADVYSLGASLYHLLAGRPPFQASSPAETILQVLEDDAVSPKELNPNVDQDLETICLRALQKEPHLRFESADDLAADLERFLRHEPVKSRPLGPFKRLLKWRRRHPLIALMAAGLLLLLFAIIAAIGIGWYQTHQMFQRQMATSQAGQSSLNELFTFIRTEPLLDQPGQEIVRRQLLDRGIQHYKSLLALAAENETLSADIVTAQVTMGLLTLEMDGPRPSLSHFRDAISHSMHLTDKQRTSMQVQTALGDAWNGLGQALHQLDKFVDASKSFDESIQIRKSIVKRSQRNVDARRKLINGVMNRGLVDAAAGNPKQAIERQTSAQVQRKELLKGHPNNKFVRRDYAKGQFNLARLHLTNSNLILGTELLQDATSRFEAIVQSSPTDARLWLRYIECLLTSSMFAERDTGFPPQLEQAIEALQPLVMLAPENRTYRLRLAELYQQSIEILLPNREVSQALAAWKVMDDKLIRRLENDDHSPDTERVRLIALRQRSLISLGLGDRKGAKLQLSAALEAWEAVIARPETASLNTPGWARDWERLEELRNSIDEE